MSHTRRFLVPALLLIAASAAVASEYHGSVVARNLPYPGVTVTASREGKNLTAITDSKGHFSFSDLADGVWNIQVQMLGFEKITREVAVAPGAPAPTFELKFLTEAAINRQFGDRPQAPAQGQGRGGFQQLNVNQAAETSAIAGQGALRTEEVADLSQSSANSFLVQGSVSSAAGMGGANDWGPPGGGRGMMEGMGGLGSVPGMGLNGEPASPDQAAGMGGRGGRGGGPGGGMAMGGGRGGGMGGPPGGGGPGGPGGGMGGGRGGPGGGPESFGGRGGGRGGPDWMGRPGAMAFGNNRRNPALSYQASANFSLNNSIWDARTFSVTGAAIDKPAYASGRGGFTLGGPLRIPKLVSASKRIMFTIDFNMSRGRTGTNSQPVKVPTAAERAGDFSASGVTLIDPLSGLPFPGNIIPANRIDSAAASLLGYYPTANLSGSAQNYQTSWNGTSNSTNLNSRLSNIRIGTKDRLNFSLGFQNQNSSTPNLFQFLDTGSGRSLNAGLQWSRNFNTRVTNNVQLSFSRQRQQQLPYFAFTENVAADLGINGTSQNPLNWGPPNLGFTNYATLSDGNASLNRNQTASLGESLSWIHGTHNLTFGGDYRRQQFNQFADANGRGSFSFNGTVTGYDLADFLLGLPTTSSIRYGNPDKYLRGTGYDAYVNDDWRIRPNFSVTLGLRWEYGTPVSEKYGRLVNLVMGPAYSTVALAQGNELINGDRNNFSPRLGIAWRPRNGKSMVVRAGYGMYYNTSVYNTIASNLAQQPPFAQTVNASTSSAQVLTIQNGFVATAAQGVANTYAIDPNYKIGYAQTWNFTVQSDLKFGLFGTAGYLGTKGTRLDQQFLPNSVAPGAVESIYPHGFIYETSNGDSIYHAAQFQLNRRMRSGLMANASYQFSKSIDDAGTGGRGQGGTPVAQNWLDLSAERALSSFDARHNFNVQFMYSTGMGRSGGALLNGWKGKLLKDWNLMANYNIHSGNPLTATSGGSRTQVSGTAVSGTLRANATGLPVSSAGQLFNAAAFTPAVSGTWGTAGRNTIPGPASFSLNGSVGRVFRFGERRSIDIQMQAQNILNRVTITNWGTTLGSTNYALATSAAAMRKMTASVRFRF